MNYDDARRKIILYSLVLTGLLLPFFFLAQAFVYPLSSDQSTQTLSLIVPVFLGYLGSGIAFVFNPPGNALPEPSDATRALLRLLINGAFAVFALGFVSLLTGFGWANRLGATPGSGMSFQAFSNGITLTLSIMTTVVGGSVIFLFGAQAKVPVSENPPADTPQKVAAPPT
jgi:hypothetical protein